MPVSPHPPRTAPQDAPEDPWTIRPYRTADRAALNALFQATWAADSYPAGVTNAQEVVPWLWRAPMTRQWVAVATTAPDASLLGHVALRSAEGHEHAQEWATATGADLASLAVVVRLAVHPDHRRAGIGRALLDTASATGGTLVLDAVRTHRSADALYANYGLSVVGRVDYHAPDGQVHEKLLWADLAAPMR